jgi:hypothetical protein
MSECKAPGNLDVLMEEPRKRVKDAAEKILLSSDKE